MWNISEDGVKYLKMEDGNILYTSNGVYDGFLD